MIKHFIENGRSLSGISLLFLLSSCFSFSHKMRKVTIVEQGGADTEYEVRQGTSFDYSISDNGRLFMGCYEKEGGEGKKFVTHDGKSVIWGESMPDKLYSYYVPKDHLSFSADPLNEKNSIKASDGNGEHKLTFDEAYVAYRKEKNRKALAEVSFSYMDNPNTVWDNWSDFRIECNEKTIYKNTLRANVEPVPFSEIFEIDSLDLAKGLSVFYSHPTANRSGEVSKITDFRFQVRLFTQEELHSEISFDKLGRDFVQYLPDGSQYRRLATKEANPASNIPYYVKKLIQKSSDSHLNVDFSISNYGQKGNALLFQFSNWIDAYCKALDSNGNEIISKFVKLESNSQYTIAKCSIDRDREQAKKREKVSVCLKFPDANASGQTYQTKFIKVSYQFINSNGQD